MARTTRPLHRRRAVSDADKERRRDDILDAAKAEFAEKGFTATTIADVARRAELSYGSVYWYFDSKDELFHTLMASEEQALRDAVSTATAAVDAPMGDPEVLRVAVQATFEFFESDAATVKLLFRDAYALGGGIEEHLGGIYERFLDQLELFVVAAQERGEMIDASPRLTAVGLGALIGQLCYRRLATDDGVDAAGVADFAVHFALDGLRPRPPGADER